MIRKKWRGGEPVLSVETEAEFWKAVTGRMKIDDMYSVVVVYNDLPAAARLRARQRGLFGVGAAGASCARRSRWPPWDDIRPISMTPT